MRVQNILKWKTSVVLFDSYLSDRSTEIIKALETSSAEGVYSQFQPMSIYLYNVNSTGPGISTSRSESNYESILQYYKKFKYNQFIVFSSSIQEVIEVAKKLNLLDTFNQWLFFIPPAKEISDIHSITEGIVEGANVAFAFNSTRQGSCNVRIRKHMHFNNPVKLLGIFLTCQKKVGNLFLKCTNMILLFLSFNSKL